MFKKALLITILISLIGCVAFAQSQQAPRQGKAKVQARQKYMQKVAKWSNDLKAAYEAEDMDKIGELIEQMDKFKARIRKAHAPQKTKDGIADEKGDEEKRFSKRGHKNRPGMEKPMKRTHRRDIEQCDDYDTDNCKDDRPANAKAKRFWRNREYSDQGQYQRPYRQFTKRPRNDNRRAMRRFQSDRQDFEFAEDDQFVPRRFARQRYCGMQKRFARRGRRMYGPYRDQWQGQRRYHQKRRFAGNMMDQRPMRQWKRQRQCRDFDNWQRPGAMKQKAKFRQHRRMACGFDDFPKAQCPNYRQQGQFNDEPCYQTRPWKRSNFKGPHNNRQRPGRKYQQITPDGNEWDW